jgi:D-tyrosyl-tRNA(Tyr) deacylase
MGLVLLELEKGYGITDVRGARGAGRRRTTPHQEITDSVRIVLQRVIEAAVRVGEEEVGRIGPGLLVLVAVEGGDGPGQVRVAAEKLAGLRIFDDGQGKMNLDLAAVGGEILLVSQFTLAGSVARGRRPSFDRAAPPEEAKPLLEALVADLRGRGFRVATGRFRSHMRVSSINDGPVTLIVDF